MLVGLPVMTVKTRTVALKPYFLIKIGDNA